jgi:hypothetical protein
MEALDLKCELIIEVTGAARDALRLPSADVGDGIEDPPGAWSTRRVVVKSLLWAVMSFSLPGLMLSTSKSSVLTLMTMTAGLASFLQGPLPSPYLAKQAAKIGT